jgi:hypothetical protein
MSEKPSSGGDGGLTVAFSIFLVGLVLFIPWTVWVIEHGRVVLS